LKILKFEKQVLSVPASAADPIQTLDEAAAILRKPHCKVIHM
jgi:hypothetical protein